MPVPRDGDTLCPTGAVVLRGRRGVVERNSGRSTWNVGECTWCGKQITDRRRSTWCSQWCVDAFQATQPDSQRGELETRDGGVCSLCGLDTYRIMRTCRQWWGRWKTHAIGYQRGQHPMDRLAALLTHIGRPTSGRQIRHLMGERVCWWDMDHCIPIVDGGHPYDPRNLRTLCVWCHARETSRAATRRADRRHGARDTTNQVDLFSDACHSGHGD